MWWAVGFQAGMLFYVQNVISLTFLCAALADGLLLGHRVCLWECSQDPQPLPLQDSPLLVVSPLCHLCLFLVSMRICNQCYQ